MRDGEARNDLRMFTTPAVANPTGPVNPIKTGAYRTKPIQCEARIIQQVFEISSAFELALWAFNLVLTAGQ